MQPSRANEIAELVQRLGSRSTTRADAARARLSIIGARAVESLIEPLEGDNNRVRARAMPLLALIQDPRGREPLIAMLLDRSAKLREIAAGCLARFPSDEAAAALNRALQKDRRVEVRIAAVRSLVEQYAAGQENAIRLVLQVLNDAEEVQSVRLAALALLDALRPSQRQSILARLANDADSEIRSAADVQSRRDDADKEPQAGQLRALLVDLASGDYATWNEAVRRLTQCGAPAIRPLTTEMQRHAHDPEYCVRAGMVLRALGPRRGRSLAQSLDELEEPLPLQVLVEVIGALGERSLIYRLKDLIERIAEASTSTQASGFDPLQRVRAKSHLELAKIGSRVAIGDLRECLSDPDRRAELEVVAAIELIGKREEILLLLRLYSREDSFMQQRIAAAVRAIMKRERIRRNNRMFQGIKRAERRVLLAILPPISSGRARRTPRHRSEAAS